MRENSINKKDVIILRELSTNARIPITKIAKVLSISDVAVKRRLVKLEENGIIKKYTYISNNKKLGYDIIALVGLNTLPDKILDVIKLIKDRDDVTFVALSSGDHNLLVEIWAKNSEELTKVVEDLRRIPGVVAVYPAIILDVIKEREPIPQRFLKEALEGSV
ncbi:MAG: Lrp/AsnC family transcriptional regulator [Zestosphaera sp.]